MFVYSCVHKNIPCVNGCFWDCHKHFWKRFPFPKQIEFFRDVYILFFVYNMLYMSLNFWKSPFHSRIKDHEDGNMLDNFYNNKLIDLNFKTKSLYLLSDIENFLRKTRYYLNYLPWSFDGHGPMKILWFQHGGHSVLRKLNIWSKCHCSIQVRKYCIRK